jgi:Na+-driven multidrug efflux pump
MAAYLFVVYSVCRPFGASAQAGFGIGLRLVQALFLPIVALGFAVAPVAGQNVGAKRGDRARAAFRSAAGMATLVMFVAALVCNLASRPLLEIFSNDPAVIDVGADYLRITAWSFIGSGIVFVSSSMFQALGNTIPPLVTSFTRILLVTIPVVLLSRLPGFELQTIWYLSVAGVFLQMIANLVLLQREFRLRLPAAPSDHPSLSA